MPGLARSVLNYGRNAGISAMGAAGRGGIGLLGYMGRGGMQAGTVYGGLAGGTYGAFSSDTSVLGGMAMGAGMGRYGYPAARYMAKRTMHPRSPFSMTMGGNHGMLNIARGAARMTAKQMARDGRRAGRYIGGGLSQGYNRFRGLGR